MTRRQQLINEVATKIAKTNDYHLKPEIADLQIKVIEATTDIDEGYVITTTERQWKRYSNEVLKLAETLHWSKYHRLFDC